MPASTAQFALALEVARAVTATHGGDRGAALSTLVGATATICCDGTQDVEWLGIAIASLEVARDLAAKRRIAAITQRIEVLS